MPPQKSSPSCCDYIPGGSVWVSLGSAPAAQDRQGTGSADFIPTLALACFATVDFS